MGADEVSGASEIGKRIQWALDASDKTQAQLAAALDRPTSAVSDIVNRGRVIRPNGRWGEIAKFLGVHLSWLLTGSGPTWLNPLENDDIDDQIQRVPLHMEARAYAHGHYEPEIPGALPEVDVSAGAGEGTVGEIFNLKVGSDTISGHRVVAEWKVPDPYLQYELRLSGRETIIVPVQGDSMSPTFRSGDRVIVDLRSREFSSDDIYLITDGSSAPRIKRLEYIFKSNPPAVRVISDNPASREQIVELSDIQIVGRVAGRITR